MKKAFLWLALAVPMVAAAWSIPMQLALQVPFEPTVFTGAGRAVVMYELQLTNFSDKTIDLRRIEVFDADEAGGKLLATFDGEQIDALLLSAGPRQVNVAATVVLFMQVALDSKAQMPKA